MKYTDFLVEKQNINHDNGFDIDVSEVNQILYPFQQAIVKWGIRKGRCSVFADCGLGKTFIQLEWLRIILSKEGGKGLIIVPLSVAEQTIQEARKLDIEVTYVKSQDEAGEHEFCITNYERLKDFNSSKFTAVVADESSIFKSIGGKIKNIATEMFIDIPFKMTCTATPAPNDIAEIANQVGFLGIMTREEMLSKFFVHDDNGWRLKGHATTDFFRWMASWSVFLRVPLDIGFENNGYMLPKLKIDAIYTKNEYIPADELFPKTTLKGIGDRLRERQSTIKFKAEVLADIVNRDKDQWLIWCGLNDEADMLERMIPDASQVKGQQDIEVKTDRILKFKRGEIRVLVTKPKIAGFGMNFQNAHNMAFLGLSDSYEYYYQCIRRCWRFGQTEPVRVELVLTNPEQAILVNVKRKEIEAAKLIDGVIREVSEFNKIELGRGGKKHMENYKVHKESSDGWEIHLGDSVEMIKDMGENMVDHTIFSPPFSQLYTYSPSPRDLGNAKNDAEFWGHFDYLIPELLRVIKPGRITAVHCAQIPAMLVRDGYIGLKDFRGDVIRHFIKHGFIYHGEVCIDKNPQAQSIRTHAKGLTFSQLEKDSSWMRPALADYLVLFRKHGENEVEVINGNIDKAEVSRDEWIRLAHPIWYNIRETKTLNVREARSQDDEKHICPLQLETIHNALMLWSNPGELIYSPFAGIGSEGYQAITAGRRFIGCELKREYFNVAVKNLKLAEKEVAESHLVLFKDEAGR